MTDHNVNQYCLVKDNEVIFGPRRYYKPAFLKYLKLNDIDIELPDELGELITHISDTYSLVHESQLDSLVKTKIIEENNDKIIEVDSTSELEDEEESLVEEVVMVPTVITRSVSRKKK